MERTDGQRGDECEECADEVVGGIFERQFVELWEWAAVVRTAWAGVRAGGGGGGTARTKERGTFPNDITKVVWGTRSGARVKKRTIPGHGHPTRFSNANSIGDHTNAVQY